VESLEELRRQIDQCDKELADAFCRRMAVVEKVAACKRRGGLPVFDPVREETVLEAVGTKYDSEYRSELQDFFASIMRISRGYQSRQLFPYHIVLIGFMGTGKTSVGKMLSDWLHRPFVDLDEMIETEEGRSIGDIFAADGEDEFRRLEHEAIRRHTGGRYAVLSCGGGAVLRLDNVELLQASGRLVLLEATPDTVKERVHGGEERPVLHGGNDVEDIRRLMEMRKRAYHNAADTAVQTDDRSVEEVAEEIVDRLLEMGSAAESSKEQCP